MTSKKKPPIKGADPGAFNVNWEVQAEQLKYSVKKEVEEANLIEEALKSLQRSFKAEEEKRKQAEYQRDLLLKQIQELESNARELKELIRTTRRERKSLAGASSSHDSHSDSDSDNEQGNGVYDYDSHSVDQILRTSRVVAVQDLEEDFDALLDELRGGHSEGQSSYMSMGQRLKILRGFTTVGKPVQRQEQSQQRYLDKHKQLMKQWIKRENAVHIITFDEVSRFTFDAHHRKVREAALIDFLRMEDGFLAQIQQVIELIKAFLNSRAFTMDDIQLIFDNSASLFEKQSQLKSFAAAALKETHDLCALGRYLRATAETYQEFLEARKQSKEYLASQRAQFRAKYNSVRTNENSINDLLDSFIPYITRYPSFIAGLFSHINEHEYEAFGMALPHLCKAFHETNTPFDLPAIPSKAQMYAIQASFDWQNKDGTFIAHNRGLLLNIPLYRRKKDLSRELVGLLLFSDVVVITREHSGKQIFNTFIPLNNVLVWDVPSKAVENPEYPIELVDVQNKKKTVLLCASEKQQSDILSAFITATLAAVE